jgi:uncharacterized membrane protein YkoI
MGVRRPVLLIVATVFSVAATCGPPRTTISRERAITIASSQISFSPDSVEAQLTTTGGASVWRVTFRGRLPGQPPPLFETVIVEIDAQSGRIVSVART